MQDWFQSYGVVKGMIAKGWMAKWWSSIGECLLPTGIHCLVLGVSTVNKKKVTI